MLLYKKLARISALCQYLENYFGIGYRHYSAQNIHHLWRLSGLTIEDVSIHFCKSYEQARKYCYGVEISPKVRQEVALYFIEVKRGKAMAKIKREDLA